MSDKRREQRRFTNAMFAISWQDARGQNHSVRARGMNVSKSGIRIESTEELAHGATVTLQAEQHELAGRATVRNCTRRGSNFVIGLEFSEETRRTVRLPLVDAIDYYEVLQVSPNAEPETIHRVYRIMAARFHPDNPQTGDSERFLLLNDAYEMLSDPDKRANYDAARRVADCQPLPAFELKEFVDGIEGEQNRRLGVLCLLYNRRRRDMEHPGLSLLDLERLMSFPREYIAFAIWYLRDKGFVKMGDNSDYVLTAEGAEYAETNSPRHAVLHKLLRA
ncbi:MAG TPA: DnaJ domain-containing protein [Bryobacteraceae bacterium]|nr:DnaJ domain-containing protein [Bryobacteraceae bacterium]